MQPGQWLEPTRVDTPPKNKGMLDMRDRDNIPGPAGQRTPLERTDVVSEVGDDHFHDFIRDAAGRFACRLLGRVTE